MKRFFVLLFFVLQYYIVTGQYNNEWIDYNKTYYKFKVGSAGLYRIPQNTLAAAGLSTADATAFQLWRNGKEIPIYTSKQSGMLGVSDYIEFWGESNDGTSDNPLYRNTADQINDKKSLFTDTSAYFLTINLSGTNKRLVPTTNIIPAGAVAEPYFMHTSGTYYTEQIHSGIPYGSGTGTLYTASYEQGKGWVSNDINNGQTRTYNESSIYAYTGTDAPNLTVNMNVVGNNDVTRNIQLSLNGTQVFDNPLIFYNYVKFSRELPAAVLSTNAANFVFTNAATTSDRVQLAFIEMKYPRLFNFGNASNFRFKIPAKATGTYLEITGFSFDGIPVLYDLSNGKRYEVDASNPSLLKVFLQPSSSEQDLVLVNEAASNLKSVSGFEVRNFINYLLPENQGNYLMITNKLLLNASTGAKPIDEYKAYRSSAAGGGYNAKVYLVDQLIDQFSFGIKFDPLGVRNFIRFARDKFSQKPKLIFLIGKGVNYVDARRSESLAGIEAINLVPVFGHPGSDVLLSAERSSSQPLTPIGRISVTNGDELSVYFNKVKQYELQLATTSPLSSENDWKKNVIHMVGANDQLTKDVLYSMLNGHKSIIQDTLYGANISDFVKSDVAATAQLTTERLASRINSGVGLLTYFGHSSSSNIGFNMDKPENYTNYGKYPLFNMMGCDVGDIFILTNDRLATFSEKYVLAKERGCIAMMAGTSIGYTNTLDLYNTKFYRLLSTENYGFTVGELMKNTISEVYAIVPESDQSQRSQCEEYTLNGDPAIRLYQYAKPDYVIEDAMVAINPNFVSVAENSFKVSAKILNVGKAVNQKLVVELKRTFPDLTTKVVQRDTIVGIRYQDSLKYIIPINPLVDKGQNKITITVDASNSIDELYETNNSITKDVFIYEDELRPVYPYNYAIVNKQGIKFSATTADPLSASKSYIMEIDTSKMFNSSLKKTQTVTSVGGLIEFTPGITFLDSTVYYWRVATVPASQTEQPKWNYSSLIYINGTEEGYNQSHIYQFTEDSYSTLEIDTTKRIFNFSLLNSSISVTTGINVAFASDIQLTVADVVSQRGLLSPLEAQQNSLRFYIVNNKTMEVIKNRDLGTSGLYGSYRPLPWNTASNPYFFQFDISTTANRQKVMNFFDSIPEGYYVAITNSEYISTVLPQIWKQDESTLGQGVSLYHKFKNLGLTGIDDVTSFVPFIFIFQKGNPVPLLQTVAKTSSEVLRVTAMVKTYSNNGAMQTLLLGPAQQWKYLKWDGYSLENPTMDKPVVSLVGITNAGAEATLMTDIDASQKTVDISSINAQQYPYLRLQLKNVDSTNNTPYQLKYWRVFYTPAPEGVIAPNIYYNIKDTLEIGEPMNVGIAFKNVSGYKFDSLKVKLVIRNNNNLQTVLPVPLQKDIISGDTIRFSFPIDTKQFTGNNQLYLEFNPDNHQPEQYHFNNFIYKNFYVRSDTSNPYLDVTFDGQHILNKDIVSTKPDILIRLTDEAKWLLLNSSDLVKVQLKFPDGSMKDFNYNSDTLIFTPAGSNGSNTATINFRPRLIQDGTYELVVTAKDQSGNQAGSMQYRVAFQVINKPMISNLLNYPNPFTTSTAFVFTLTGAEIPQNIRIQILTITGKIVREITKEELGPLKIGRNITEYKWDGTDQFGQKLANGVYLYRVITNHNGKALDKYRASNDNTDQYFNRGYGKMYLMR